MKRSSLGAVLRAARLDLVSATSGSACPTCQARGREERPPRGAPTRIGPPFEECPRCRALIPRPGALEWDLLGPRGRLRWTLARLLPWSLALGLPVLGYGLLGYRGEPGQARTLAGLGACALVLFLALPVPALRRIVRRSRLRMSDPMYRARLVAFERRAEA